MIRILVYLFGIILMLLSIIYFIARIIDISISIKYETRGGDNCISMVSGQDLCSAENRLKLYLIICISILLLIVIFSKRIIGYNQYNNYYNRFKEYFNL